MAAPPITQANVGGHFLSAQTAIRNCVSVHRASAADGHWYSWENFCRLLALDPFCSNIEDPIPIFQAFAAGYRAGDYAPSGRQVRSRTVEDALRAVGQTIALLGPRDPRLTDGKLNLRLRNLLTSYAKEDPPPHRVKPIPLAVLKNIANIAAQPTADAAQQATADMITLGFFFLLRPGEYTNTPSESTPFRLCDVILSEGQNRIDWCTATTEEIRRATHVKLVFTTQKNGVRNEVICNGRSGDSQFCPTLAAIRRILHLKQHQASNTSPLACYYTGTKWRSVSATEISTTLKHAVTIFGPSLGFLPQEVSSRSLRASGAMALLVAGVDTDRIKLMGRWRSDAMLRYLTVQAEPIMRHFAEKMLQGDYVLHANGTVPLH